MTTLYPGWVSPIRQHTALVEVLLKTHRQIGGHRIAIATESEQGLPNLILFAELVDLGDRGVAERVTHLTHPVQQRVGPLASKHPSSSVRHPFVRPQPGLRP